MRGGVSDVALVVDQSGHVMPWRSGGREEWHGWSNRAVVGEGSSPAFNLVLTAFPTYPTIPSIHLLQEDGQFAGTSTQDLINLGRPVTYLFSK
jgi:hypothetical protein